MKKRSISLYSVYVYSIFKLLQQVVKIKNNRRRIKKKEKDAITTIETAAKNAKDTSNLLLQQPKIVPKATLDF